MAKEHASLHANSYQSLKNSWNQIGRKRLIIYIEYCLTKKKQLAMHCEMISLSKGTPTTSLLIVFKCTLKKYTPSDSYYMY
jgi:hypothetical protein